MEEKGLVIDSYCGSGTTLVAAKMLKHDLIGIYRKAHYVCHGAVRELRL
ncbi:MAG: DNA methyltransferase [Bacteroidia bacterium]